MCYFQLLLIGGGKNTTFFFCLRHCVLWTQIVSRTHPVTAQVIWLYDEDVCCAVVSLSCLLFFSLPATHWWPLAMYFLKETHT